MRYVSAPTRHTRRPARRACAASLAIVVVLPSPGGPKKSRTIEAGAAAAVTVTCPAASVVSRITASGPSVPFTCFSASAIVGAVNRLTFIERHHPERPEPHVRADLRGRDDGKRRKHALDEPPHVRAERRRAEQQRREMLGAEALDPLGEPPEEALRERRLERRARPVAAPRHGGD